MVTKRLPRVSYCIRCNTKTREDGTCQNPVCVLYTQKVVNSKPDDEKEKP